MPRETYFTVYLKLYLIIKIKKNLPYLSISFEIWTFIENVIVSNEVSIIFLNTGDY